MRPFSAVGVSHAPVDKAYDHSLNTGRGFEKSALNARSQADAGLYPVQHYDLGFVPVAGWASDFSAGVHVEPSVMQLAGDQAGVDAFSQWAHSDGTDDVPELTFTPANATVSLLPENVKAVISARLATAPADRDDILQVIADEILVETGVVVTERDVAQQLQQDHAAVKAALQEADVAQQLQQDHAAVIAALNEADAPQQAVEIKEYIPEGGGPGIRRDAEGRVSTTELGILPSELQARLAPYKALRADISVVDPENPAKMVKLVSLRTRYRNRVLVPDPLDDAKLIRQGTLHSRFSDQKLAIDENKKPQLTSRTVAKLRREGHVFSSADMSVMAVRPATKKSFRRSKRLEDAQKNIEAYPVGYEGGQRNFTAASLVRDPENPNKVVYGSTLIKREQARILVRDEDNNGALVTRGALERYKRLVASNNKK